MLYLRSVFLALLSAPLTILASAPNPFKIPSTGLSATAGQSMSLQWTPTTSGTVSLVLRSGNSADLEAGTVIASSIQNSGSYNWSVPSTITRGSDYTIEIVDDSDPSQTNYTPYFVLDSTVTSSYSTSEVTIGAPSSTIHTSTASPTGSVTTSTGTSSGSSSSAGSSNSASMTSGSMSSGASSMMATSTSAGSSSAASSAVPSAATQSSSAASNMKPAAVGLLGLAAYAVWAL